MSNSNLYNIEKSLPLGIVPFLITCKIANPDELYYEKRCELLIFIKQTSTFIRISIHHKIFHMLKEFKALII